MIFLCLKPRNSSEWILGERKSQFMNNKILFIKHSTIKRNVALDFSLLIFSRVHFPLFPVSHSAPIPESCAVHFAVVFHHKLGIPLSPVSCIISLRLCSSYLRSMNFYIGPSESAADVQASERSAESQSDSGSAGESLGRGNTFNAVLSSEFFAVFGRGRKMKSYLIIFGAARV